MKIQSYKTKKIIPGDNIHQILDDHLPQLHEKEIVIITSKIVALCQGNVVKNDGTIDKHDLAKKEAEYFIDESLSQYNLLLTIKRDMLIINAGIDESNGDGYFILWPKDPDLAAAKIWEYLRKKYNIKELGVLITESRTTPLRWGTLGVGLAYCGFEPLKNYIGTPDIFGRELMMTKLSILDGLAAAAVTLMGEGDEQTPLAVISDYPKIQFSNKPPSKEELNSIRISRKDDIYAPFTNSAVWKKGGNSNQSSTI